MTILNANICVFGFAMNRVLFVLRNFRESQQSLPGRKIVLNFLCRKLKLLLKHLKG